ncbi:MAG: hypothetical protein E6I84_07560 [Chloroflexi bacterium]|nr:MAG: hypothetical protein E6I84_07560 [Chloroflexota bacterium]
MTMDRGSERSRRRRAVLDDARRKVERALAVSEAADQLAAAAQDVLAGAEVEETDRDVRLETLRAALATYRARTGT